MTGRRPFVTALTGAALLLVLAGCEKPTPAVTLQSGNDTGRTEAALFCTSVAALEAQKCAESPERVQIIRAAPGARINVSVDKALTKTGWYLVDADAKQRSAVQDTHHFSLTADFANRPTSGIINLEIRSLDRVADTARVLGVWKFQVIQK